MRCPFCQTEDTKVIDSRLGGDGDQVRRRRECIICQERFTTYETIELSFPRLVKRDGSCVQFREEKLRGGILRSLEKRPVRTEQVDAAVTRILNRLRASGEREIETRVLGEWVMAELRALDEVAYVRFASVYRRFQDIDEFGEEIARLRNSNQEQDQTIESKHEHEQKQKQESTAST
jgi:transcriptional repressor NrdR